MEWRRHLRIAGAMAMVAGAGLLSTMSPASAVGAGVTTNGYSNTTGNAQPEIPLCLPATGITIKLYSVGPFNSAAAAVPTTTTFTSTTDFWFGPAGTFSNSLCTIPTDAPVLGTPITGTIGVTGAGGCTGATGAASYRRVNSNYEIHSTGGTCGALVHTGSQQPCAPVGPDTCGPDGPTATEFAGSYVQG